jgi:3D (Asp-Asp-Asp) domain-containing protein
MTDNQTVRIHGHLHKITRKLFVVTMLLIALIILVSFCTALILGNLANISVAQEDTLNQIMELRQEGELVEINPITGTIPDEPVSLGTFTVTHYCSCAICCGKSDGITATGTIATEGRTVAVDPDVIPLGSEILIDGQAYIAEDIGGAVKGNKVDIYVSSHQEAIQRGKLQREVWRP